jgi:hypothetical protein
VQEPLTEVDEDAEAAEELATVDTEKQLERVTDSIVLALSGFRFRPSAISPNLVWQLDGFYAGTEKGITARNC